MLRHLFDVVEESDTFTLGAFLGLRNEGGRSMLLLIIGKLFFVARKDERLRHKVIVVGLLFNGHTHHRLEGFLATQLFDDLRVPIDYFVLLFKGRLDDLLVCCVPYKVQVVVVCVALFPLVLLHDFLEHEISIFGVFTVDSECFATRLLHFLLDSLPDGFFRGRFGRRQRRAESDA